MKELNILIKAAQKQGWTVERTPNNHYKWVSPVGGMFFSSSTPSDYRSVKNLKRDLRVNGFIELTRKKGKRT